MSQQPQQPARASYQPEGEFGQEHKNQVEDLPSRVKGKILRYKIDTKTAEKQCVGRSLHHMNQKINTKKRAHPHLPMSRDTSDLKLDLSHFTTRNHPKESLKIAKLLDSKSQIKET